MSRWQAIIFDLDDTLYPEREYVLSGFRAVSAWAEESQRVPREEAFQELSRLYAAGIRGDTFNRWLADHGLPDSLVPQMIKVYRGHSPSLQPFPGVYSLLAALRTRVRLGLVSDGYWTVQRAKFAALGLNGYFSAVVFSDELGRDSWKPAAAPFLKVLAELKVSPDQAVYVGDNCIKDFIGARRAGLGTIWARHSGGDYAVQPPSSEAHAADLVVDSLSSLEAILNQG